MKTNKLLTTILIVVSFVISSCVTKKKISDDDFAMEDEPAAVENLSLDSTSENQTTAKSDSSMADSQSPAKDEFSDFSDSAATSSNEPQVVAQKTEGNQPSDELSLDDPAPAKSDELSLDTNNTGSEQPQAIAEQAPPQPEVLSLDEPQVNQPAEPTPIVEQKNEVTQEPVSIAPTPPEPQPIVSQPIQSLAHISDLKFLANENGGTLVISSDKSVQFKTRMNTANNQLIVEVQDAVVPDRLKRPLNTKDMTSTIGGIDIYQNKGSKIARFVIQLRANSPEPVVQPEGNSILVVGSLNPAIQKSTVDNIASSGDKVDMPKAGAEADGLGILGSESLDDFLANNNKYYGRKINFEVNDMDVHDAIKFIAEESGINLIMDSGTGTGKVTMKLRNVPWDQVFVAILKSNQLAYRRQGDVIRIGTQKNLLDEEDSAIQLKRSREDLEPLIVKNFLINYAEVNDLEKKIKDFISQSSSGADAAGGAAAGGKAAQPGAQAGASVGGASQAGVNSLGGTTSKGAGRGRVTSDARTNVLIVTETASRLKEVEKLINLLDRQPQQVMIEARVVEASEDYSRAIGTNFCANGFDGTGCGITNSSRINSAVNGVGISGKTLTASPAFQFTPKTSGAFGASLWLGTLGSFGDLATTLSLDESENKVKILSSPRIYLLHGTAGSIQQTTKVPVPKVKTTALSTGTTSTDIDQVDAGLVLNVTPLISNVGTVNMKINLKKDVVNAAGAIATKTVDTSLIVRSGETAVVGGVYTSEGNNGMAGIPGLKDIPILGWLFRSETLSKAKTELMFFVSPRILNDLNTTTQAAAEQQAAKF